MARYVAARAWTLWIRHVLVPGLTDDADGLRQLDAFIKKNAAHRAPRRNSCLPHAGTVQVAGTLVSCRWTACVPTAEEVETMEQLCMCAIIPVMHPRAAPQSNFYKILGIILRKYFDITATYGKAICVVGDLLTATNLEPPAGCFCLSVRFLPITGCASRFWRFCSAPFGGLLIAIFAPIRSLLRTVGVFVQRKSATSRPRETAAAFCGLYVGRCLTARRASRRRPYSGEPQTFPLWQTSAKVVLGTIAACGPETPARAADESARLRELPRADIESALREIAAAPYGGERGRTSREPIFQQQPPPVVESFPGRRLRFITA